VEGEAVTAKDYSPYWPAMLQRVRDALEQTRAYNIGLRAKIDYVKSQNGDVREMRKNLKLARQQELCLEDQERRLKDAIEGAKASS